MKRLLAVFALAMALLAVVATPVGAHEEGHDEPVPTSAVTKAGGDELVQPQSKTAPCYAMGHGTTYWTSHGTRHAAVFVYHTVYNLYDTYYVYHRVETPSGWQWLYQGNVSCWRGIH